MCKPLIRFFLRNLPLIVFPRLNVKLNNLLGYQVASSARVYSSVIIMGDISVIIGNNTFIGHQTLITGGGASIKIGENCDISDRVGIFCGSHEVSTDGIKSAGKGIGKDIHINDGVWIGFGALILPGVTIGKCSIIAAGAVIHKDVPPYSVVAGNPMSVIKQLTVSV